MSSTFIPPPSPQPHLVIDEDDDEFDWEAAVREIDVACAATSSNSIRRPHHPPPKSRQSTLDNFIARKSTGQIPSSNHIKLVDVRITGGGADEEQDNGGIYSHVDLEAAKTWIYPVNDSVPLREYQLSITKTALFSNTMVALPTGLGKTFIAAVVMYNYFRWFPEGKIVFAAPSRPLVMQQIEACHNIVGIPQEWAIDMTGQTSPSNRACLWKAKRVFFVTPQVLEKDIQSGACLVRHLVCLVIDEAHRATGNYSYCVAVRELLAVQLQFRILALSATPGSKQQAIQSVINNLHISKLEHRDESDHDVSPYVHNRKLELIKVAMGKDATEIDHLLLETIKPFVARLGSYGLLPNRDYQTLSPCDLLTSRDKFHKAPPSDLPQITIQELTGYFGVLITLYHVRKLLSSHGIKPTYELLEEKLKQGYVAKYLSRNQVILNAKRLMVQSLSHGTPNPKLLKMIEILIDHFKANDSKKCRVIIFSNFRGSVRDIMESLSSIGELVKATEFIGQSSGKILKGQTQKVQQAVLQNFRAGEFNVIVATCIGEEGLDIMEVDLVICFDANISPLRMIQRMGRTGRKHDGRVVVLACEGTELKGYLRKQANCKSVRKHMRNGGMNSFQFHASPRMIPHICKPEVQFVKLSIEEFLPRGRKVKDDSLSRATFRNKLSIAETELLAKYFRSSGESFWKPSLIAFPHFQAFPSRVHKVMHSFRTRMLIDTMQHLQVLPFCNDIKTLPVEVETEASSCHSLEVETAPQDGRSDKELVSLHESPVSQSKRRIPDFETSPTVVLRCREKHHLLPNLNPSHCFIFGTEFVSLDNCGVVSIASLPSFYFIKEVSPCKNTVACNMEFVNRVDQSSIPPRMSFGDEGELSIKVPASSMNPAELMAINSDLVLSSRLCSSDTHGEQTLHEVEGIIFLPPSPKRTGINSDEPVFETPAITRKTIPIFLTNECTSDYTDVYMSPRLTSMLQEGVVPESPLGEAGDDFINKQVVCMCDSSEHVNCGSLPNSSTEVQRSKFPTEKIPHPSERSNCKVKSESSSSVHVSPFLHTKVRSKGSSSGNTINVKTHKSADGREYLSTIIGEVHTPSADMNNYTNLPGHVIGSPIIEGIQSPLLDLTNNCSNDWHLSSDEASKSITQATKFKRLRKHGEFAKRMSTESTNDFANGVIANLSRCFATRPNQMKHRKAKQKLVTHSNAFIEEEAEVSSDAEVSDDEEEDKDTDSYDDSFVDDKVNPTAASTQAETGIDMMAFYRRSLLTQSPLENSPDGSTAFTPIIFHSRTETGYTESCSSGKAHDSQQTPHTGLQSKNQSPLWTSNSCQFGSSKASLVAIPGETSAVRKEETKTENRKRKLSFNQVCHGPDASLQSQLIFQSNTTGKASVQCQSKTEGLHVGLISDDQFYEGLDLDELEAQATKLVKQKARLPVEPRPSDSHNSTSQGSFHFMNSPSFDLGI